MRHRRAQTVRDLAHAVHGLERFLLGSLLAVTRLFAALAEEAGSRAAGGHLVRALELPGQRRLRERRVAEHAHVVLDTDRECLEFRGAEEKTVCDLVHLRPQDAEEFGQVARAEVRNARDADLSLVEQRLDSGYRFLERDLMVGPVYLVDVDAVGPEAAKTCLAGPDRVLAPHLAAAQLGRDNDLAAVGPQYPADEFLGVAVPVGRGRIEQRDACIETRFDGLDRVFLVLRPPGLVADDGPAAHCDRGNLNVRPADFSVFQVSLLPD